MGEALRRVQMLIEPGQHELLADLARKQGRSVADVTREAIAIGLAQLAGQDAMVRRARALGQADELAERIQARAHKPLKIDPVEDLRALREERDEQTGSY